MADVCCASCAYVYSDRFAFCPDCGVPDKAAPFSPMTNQPAVPVLPCPCCGGEASRLRDEYVFAGQNYGDRYPEGVRNQSHGIQVRCGRCGMQTCWWHYEAEADAAWNRRTPAAALAAAGEDARDAGRLDMLAAEYWTLEPFDMPTGQGDADVGWRVTQYVGIGYRPKVIAEHGFDNPRAALDAAMQATRPVDGGKGDA